MLCTDTTLGCPRVSGAA